MPDGAPGVSNPNLELMPGDLFDRESLERALDGVTIVQTIATGLPVPGYAPKIAPRLKRMARSYQEAGRL